MITGKVIPWSTWKTILLRMYERRVKIFQTCERRPWRMVWTCDGATLHAMSVHALRKRYLVERTRSGGGKVTWSLTDKGRRLAKELLR